MIPVVGTIAPVANAQVENPVSDDSDDDDPTQEQSQSGGINLQDVIDAAALGIGAYEAYQAFGNNDSGDSSDDSGDDQTASQGIQWTSVDDPGTCDVCLPLDGQVFASVDDLPFYPGDGDFGDPSNCLGGPNCRCSLSWLDQDGVMQTATNTIRNFAMQQAAANDDFYAGMNQAVQDAQEAFEASLPTTVNPAYASWAEQQGYLLPYSTVAQRYALRQDARQYLASLYGITPSQVTAGMLLQYIGGIA